MGQTAGIIDIGSNTIRLNIYEYTSSEYRLLASQNTNAGLISYVTDNNELNEKGIEKLIDVLQRYEQLVNTFHIDSCTAFATASLRNIANTREVLEAVNAKIHIPVEVLSGEEEARLSFAGVRAFLTFKEGVFLDSGGGSTEVDVFSLEGMHVIDSLPYGSLNLFVKYVHHLFPTRKEQKQIVALIAGLLKNLSSSTDLQNENLALCGGSLRAMREIMVALEWIDPLEYVFDFSLIEKLADYLFEEEDRAIRLLAKTCPDRIHTVCCGILIASTIGKMIHAKSVQICMTGIREGFLIERIMKQA